MKNCPNCKAELEDHFELCWKCNYSLTEQKIITYPDDPPVVMRKVITCLRCKVGLEFKGSYKFHEGKNYGVYGEMFENQTNKEPFDLYVCPQCKIVEFYLPE